MNRPGIQAREIAVSLLDQVRVGDATLDRVIAAAQSRIDPLSRPDRALVHALVYGVLRWQGRLDWVIDHLTSGSSSKMDPLVRIILRLGVYQIQYLDRIPTSAAVNTSVELTRLCRKKWAAGFVNAMLRGLVRRADQIPWPAREGDGQLYLAIRHAFPTWLIARWMRRWGFDATARLCQAINAIPAITLRTNSLKISRSALMRQIDAEAKGAQAAVHTPEGIHLTGLQRPLAYWPAYKSGFFQVQAEAAQLVGHLTAPRPGQRVWDACAGLGTKTAHLAQLMGNRGEIVATDVRTDKLHALRLEMARLSIDIVKTERVDLTNPSPKFKPQKFDRILVDAPCSGLGVLQRNPDGKWRVKEKHLHRNHHRQLALLSMAAEHLAPDGILVYAVCSLEPEEGENVVTCFLQKYREFGIYHAEKQAALKIEKLLVTSEGYLKTRPYPHGMDGFFAAAFRRINQQT